MANLKSHQHSFVSSLNDFLFKPVDNAPLIVFRIIFGFLIAWHCVKAFTSGFIVKNLVTPKFTYSHIGMDWLQPLPGNGMYFYYAAMGICGLMIAIGLCYRFAMLSFTLLWAGVYFMQKTFYNNHYYLLLLLGIIFLLLPANKSHAVDAKLNPKIRTDFMPAWCSWIMVFQIGIVYFFAALAKFYPDWLNGNFTAILFEKTNPNFMLGIFHQKWMHYFIAYSGLLFDLLVVPMLLWKRTRWLAFIASVLFHIFNNFHLNIGIFPLLALSFCLFFFPAEKVRKLFFRNVAVVQNDTATSANKKLVVYFLFSFFLLQLVLPIRHYFIKGDVLWTEEGHRLSWRMMLRQKSGKIKFLIRDRATSEECVFDLKDLLTKKQIKIMATKPDMIWQTAQKIKEYYQQQGKNVSIFVDSKVSLNNKPSKVFIDPKTDFATAKWNYFSHNDWILLYD